MKLNMQYPLLASVMMLTMGLVQCADVDAAMASRRDRTLWRVNNQHGHPDTVLYQWTGGNPPLILLEKWNEPWFGLDIQRKQIVYNSHDRVPPLFDFSGKKFLMGMLCGALGTGALGAVIAYVSALQSQQGVTSFVRSLTTTLYSAENSLAKQCIDSIQAAASPIDSYVKHMVPVGEGQSFIAEFRPSLVVPKIKVAKEQFAAIAGPLRDIMCDVANESVSNTIDVAAFKKALPQAATLAGGSLATLTGITQLLLGSKSFALGCIISSAATAAVLYAFASR